jgi:WD40 repeat protein
MEDDKGVCDVCNCDLSDCPASECATYSPTQFRDLVSRGLEPPDFSGMGDEDFVNNWKRTIVARSLTNWRLCPKCAHRAKELAPAAHEHCLGWHESKAWVAVVSRQGIGLTRCPGEIRLWDLARRCQIGSVRKSFTPSDWDDRVCHEVKFTPDGRKVILMRSAGLLGVWNTEALVDPTQKRPGLDVTLSGALSAFAPSFDSAKLAAGQENGVIGIYELQSGRQVQKLGGWFAGGHKNRVKGLAFSPDGNRLISSDWVGLVIIWDLRTGSKMTSHCFNGVNSGGKVGFLPDGENAYQVTGANPWEKKLIIWNTNTGAVNAAIQKYGSSGHDPTCFLGDSANPQHLIFAYSDLFVIWDLAENREISRIEFPQQLLYDACAWAVSPHAQQLLVGGVDGAVRLLEPCDPDSEGRRAGSSL